MIKESFIFSMLILTVLNGSTSLFAGPKKVSTFMIEKGESHKCKNRKCSQRIKLNSSWAHGELVTCADGHIMKYCRSCNELFMKDGWNRGHRNVGHMRVFAGRRKHGETPEINRKRRLALINAAKIRVVVAETIKSYECPTKVCDKQHHPRELFHGMRLTCSDMMKHKARYCIGCDTLVRSSEWDDHYMHLPDDDVPSGEGEGGAEAEAEAEELEEAPLEPMGGGRVEAGRVDFDAEYGILPDEFPDFWDL